MKPVKDYARLMDKFENLPEEYLPKLRRQLTELEKQEAYQYLKYKILRRAFTHVKEYEVFIALIACSEIVEREIEALKPVEKTTRKSHFRPEK